MPAPVTCQYKLRQGASLSHHIFDPGRGGRPIKMSGAYDVCITRSQHERLFGSCTDGCKPPVKLGCGKYACAYEHRDPNKVVKITHDESDIAAMLRGQDASDRMVKTFGVHKLASPTRVAGRESFHKKVQGGYMPKHVLTAYAVEVERLSPLPSKWRRTVNCAGDNMRGWHLSKMPNKFDLKHLWRCCPKSASGPVTKVCRKLVSDVVRAKLSLAEVGIRWEDLHAGNIGVNKDGRWKAIDVGNVDMPLIDTLPELAGARTRKRRR